MSSARTPRKPPRPGQKPGNTSTPPKKKPGTSFMMSDGTGIEVIDDELFYHDSDGNLRSYPPPNILQRFVTWIRSMLSSDLSRTSEGWFMAGKPKHKSKQSAEQMATLGELFEGYEDENIPRAYRSNHPGWFGEENEKRLSKKYPPLPPDPRITPQTSKGNYPKKDKE